MGLKDRFTKGAPPVEEQAPADLVESEEEAVESLPTEIRALADQKLRTKLGVRRELKALPEVLAENEQLLNLASGQYDGRQGLLAVTDRRLIFFEKGMARSRQEDFTYSKVSSIQTETKMTSGRLIIFVSGNKALIQSVYPKERVNEIGEYVRGRISDAADAGSPSPSAGPPSSPAERLRSLQAMLDQGLVSPDEFEAKRREILDSV